MRVVWSPAALRQVDQVFDFLLKLNPDAAEQVSVKLVAAGNSLANFAHRGRLVPGTEMRELITTYPYVIRYRIARDEVRILRVRHAARRSTML